MRIAIAQFSATNRLDKNLSLMLSFVEAAHNKEAELLAFPEMAYFMGASEEWQPLLRSHRTLIRQFQEWAKHYQLELVPGTIREGLEQKRHFNSLPYINKRGEHIGLYRKIFLFQANLPDRKYDERAHVEAGKQVVVVDRPWGIAGLAICYDLRFPELFRALKKKGAHVVFLPSAFPIATGQAHWKTLLQARAIENQLFIVAPALTGQCGDGRMTYGHSMVVSPWGEVLVEMDDKEGFAICDLDFSTIDSARNQIDCWASRREDLFPIQ